MLRHHLEIQPGLDRAESFAFSASFCRCIGALPQRRCTGHAAAQRSPSRATGKHTVRSKSPIHPENAG
jgi:hypothetical protein